MTPDAMAAAVVLQIKSALGPVLERLAGVEAAMQRLGAIEARILAYETKAPEDISPIRDRLVALETKIGVPSPLEGAVTDVKAALADAVSQIGGLRERVAVVEVKPLLPGPAGAPGKDGANGTDGLGFDDLVAVQENERTFVIKASRGDRVKDIGRLTFPVQIQRGVFVEGKSYDPGDLVTWAGSQWHCNEQTTIKPGDDVKAWTLVVKRGRDGRDGKDAPAALPVVSAGART